MIYIDDFTDILHSIPFFISNTSILTSLIKFFSSFAYGRDTPRQEQLHFVSHFCSSSPSVGSILDVIFILDAIKCHFASEFIFRRFASSPRFFMQKPLVDIIFGILYTMSNFSCSFSSRLLVSYYFSHVGIHLFYLFCLTSNLLVTILIF